MVSAVVVSNSFNMAGVYALVRDIHGGFQFGLQFLEIAFYSPFKRIGRSKKHQATLAVGKRFEAYGQIVRKRFAQTIDEVIAQFLAQLGATRQDHLAVPGLGYQALLLFGQTVQPSEEVGEQGLLQFEAGQVLQGLTRGGGDQ